MMRATVYFTRPDGSDVRTIYSVPDAVTPREFQLRAAAAYPGQVLAFGPISEPWGFHRPAARMDER